LLTMLQSESGLVRAGFPPSIAVLDTDICFMLREAD